MKNKIYFKTAEFASLCGTTKDTLIHYDKIGLLTPQYIAENKYRYYSVIQAEEFFTISTLKELGFSLQNIKAKLQTGSIESYCELLKEQQDIISNKIRTLEQSRESIRIHLAEIKEYTESKLDSVIIKKITQKYIILSQNIETDSPHQYVQHYSNLIEQLKTGKQSTYSRYGAIKTREQLDITYAYQNFYMETNKEISTDILPGGTYLILYVKTNFENILPSYKKIIEYAKKHSIQLDTMFYEEVIIQPMNSNTKEYIAQIMCRIIQ